MSEPNSSQTKDGARGEAAVPAPEALVRGVSDVIAAALSVGTSLARAFAEATAQGKPIVPAANPNPQPLEVFIHYGVAAVGNVVGMVAAGVGTATGRVSRTGVWPASPAAPPAATEPRRGESHPVVRAGNRLRVPLSIENGTTASMEALAITCRALSVDPVGGAGQALLAGALRFEPALLDIRPRDFEKLTVFVDTAADTAPGIYEAAIAIGVSGFETKLVFEVAP